MKKELIDEVVKGLHTKERYIYLNADTQSLDNAEKYEIANQMGKNIYCYENWGFDYYFTLSMLIEDFYAYLTNMTSLEDDKANMSLSDYMEHFGVEEFEYNREF